MRWWTAWELRSGQLRAWFHTMLRDAKRAGELVGSPSRAGVWEKVHEESDVFIPAPK